MKPSLVFIFTLFLSCQRSVNVPANEEIELSFDLGKLNLYVPSGLDSFQLVQDESCTECDSKKKHIWIGDKIIGLEFINQNGKRDTGFPAQTLIFSQPRDRKCNFNNAPDLENTLLSLEHKSAQNDPQRIILDRGIEEDDDTKLIYLVQTRMVDSMEWHESEIVIYRKGYQLGLLYQSMDIQKERFLKRSDSLIKSLELTANSLK